MKKNDFKNNKISILIAFVMFINKISLVDNKIVNVKIKVDNN